MTGEVNADPALMVDVFQVTVPTFSGDVTRVPPGRNCGSGVYGCQTLLDADQATTDRLHRFLTTLAQGISAYKKMVTDSARTYADAADLSSALLTNQVRNQNTAVSGYDPRSNLPDYAPGFDRPAGTS